MAACEIKSAEVREEAARPTRLIRCMMPCTLVVFKVLVLAVITPFLHFASTPLHPSPGIKLSTASNSKCVRHCAMWSPGLGRSFCLRYGTEAKTDDGPRASALRPLTITPPPLPTYANTARLARTHAQTSTDVSGAAAAATRDRQPFSVLASASGQSRLPLV